MLLRLPNPAARLAILATAFAHAAALARDGFVRFRFRFTRFSDLPANGATDDKDLHHVHANLSRSVDTGMQSTAWFDDISFFSLGTPNP
jgi:hypothetical protein